MLNILLGVTGSVATIKITQLTESLLEVVESSHLRLIATENSKNFFSIESLKSKITVLTDIDEWEWHQIGDPILHIELRNWADLLLIAPLDANTLSKLANGLCDNLLTNVVRAWDSRKTLLYAPSMNTMMWRNPQTKDHIKKLNMLGYVLIPPCIKTLACNETGIGAMANTNEIIQFILFFLKMI